MQSQKYTKTDVFPFPWNVSWKYYMLWQTYILCHPVFDIYILIFFHYYWRYHMCWVLYTTCLKHIVYFVYITFVAITYFACHFNVCYMYRKTSNTRRSLVGNKRADHLDVIGASPVGAVLDLTPGFNGLDSNNCKTRRSTFQFWDLVRLILDDLRYLTVTDRLLSFIEIHIRWHPRFDQYLWHW